MNRFTITVIVLLSVAILSSCQAIEEYEWGTRINDNGLVITPIEVKLLSEHETFDISPGYRLSIITLHVENQSMEAIEINDRFYESFSLFVEGDKHPSSMFIEVLKMMNVEDVHFGELYANESSVTNLYFFTTEGKHTLVYDNKKKTSWQVIKSN